MILKKKFPASACRKKKIACSTNVIESLWEKKGKKISCPPDCQKKILDDQKSPPLPPRVKWSAPKGLYYPTTVNGLHLEKKKRVIWFKLNFCVVKKNGMKPKT